MARKPARKAGGRKSSTKRKAVSRASGRRSAPRRAAAAKRGARRPAATRTTRTRGAKKTTAKRKMVKAAPKKAAARKAPPDAAAARAARKRWPRRRTPADRSPARPIRCRPNGQPGRPPEPAAFATPRDSSANGSACERSRKAFRARPPAWTWIVTASAARTGRATIRHARQEHTETSPALTGGDVDADWEDAYAVGDEAPGGDNPTPDQDRVDDIGKALGDRVSGQRGAQGLRQGRQPRQAPLGARPGVGGGLPGKRLTRRGMRDAGREFGVLRTGLRIPRTEYRVPVVTRLP